MNFNTILFIVAGVLCLVLGTICLVIASRENDAFIARVFAITLAVSFISFCCAVLNECTAKRIEKEKKTSVENAEKNDYKVFIDGREVDWDSIDFDMYDVRVDTKKKSVYCTRK